VCPPLSQAEHGVTSSAPDPSLCWGVPALTDKDVDPECLRAPRLPHGAGAHRGSLSCRSSLARERGRHLGHGRTVSREEAGGHARPTVVTLSLVTLRKG